MKSALCRAFWLLMVVALVAVAACKRDVVSKGTGDGNSKSLAVPTSTGPRVRTALVIGNSNYKSLQKLEACRHDAQVMAETFQKIGITVQGGNALFDLTTDQMDNAVRNYARTLTANSEAFVYYSGHGAQIGGSNYLLPVNFDAEYEGQARRQAFALDELLNVLEKTDSQLRVVILDACRDPGEFLPGEPSHKGATRTKGLNEQHVDAPETLVCFATKHGTAALADAKSSFYSRVLAEEIIKPGRLDDVLRTVAARVYSETDKHQLPFTYGSLLQDHFLVAPLPVVAVAPEPKVDMEAELQRRVEAELARRAAAATPAPSGLELAKLTTPAPLKTAASTNADLATATKESPLVNSLGMKFVPVPITGGPTGGQRVLFSIWDTRVKDYRAFASETKREWEEPWIAQTDDHPAVMVSWEDAQAFCQWLTQQERSLGRISLNESYRLPSDHEWSCAVGIGDRENPNAAPADKDRKIDNVFPWGTQWPPPKGAGNFADDTMHKIQSFSLLNHIEGYDDGFVYTSPVGSFAPNRFGLFDMSGNVWQWCADWYDTKHTSSVLRGGSWYNHDQGYLQSSSRHEWAPEHSNPSFGFRCVLGVSGG